MAPAKARTFPPPSMKNKTFPYTPAAVVTVIILTAGVLIRVWEIGNQIILGDEWHSINIAASSDFISIFTDFFQGTHSTPVALYYHFLLNRGFLNELLIYLPVTISGILLLLFTPVLVRRFFDDRTVLLFMAFLASAPILVFYSRYARPYSIVTLLSFVSRKNVLAGYWDSDTVNDFSVYSSVNVRAIGELKQSINIIDPNAYDDKKDYLIIFHKRLNSENTIQIKRYADEVEALLSTVNPILGDPVYEDGFVRVFLQSNDE
jgi:hypothetical protein